MLLGRKAGSPRCCNGCHYLWSMNELILKSHSTHCVTGVIYHMFASCVAHLQHMVHKHRLYSPTQKKKKKERRSSLHLCGEVANRVAPWQVFYAAILNKYNLKGELQNKLSSQTKRLFYNWKKKKKKNGTILDPLQKRFNTAVDSRRRYFREQHRLRLCLACATSFVSECRRSMLDAEGNSLWQAVCWCSGDGGWTGRRVTSNTKTSLRLFHPSPQIRTSSCPTRRGHNQAQIPALLHMYTQNFLSVE